MNKLSEYINKSLKSSNKLPNNYWEKLTEYTQKLYFAMENMKDRYALVDSIDELYTKSFTKAVKENSKINKEDARILTRLMSYSEMSFYGAGEVEGLEKIFPSHEEFFSNKLDTLGRKEVRAFFDNLVSQNTSKDFKWEFIYGDFCNYQSKELRDSKYNFERVWNKKLKKNCFNTYLMFTTFTDRGCNGDAVKVFAEEMFKTPEIVKLLKQSKLAVNVAKAFIVEHDLEGTIHLNRIMNSKMRNKPVKKSVKSKSSILSLLGL